MAGEAVDVNWQDVEWLKSITKLPILLKGVLTHEDENLRVSLLSNAFHLLAIKAMEIGVSGIVVSNRGGRQLDYTPATINALQEAYTKKQMVVDAVGGKIPILLDGGLRRGTHVFKALALGATAVMIGEPVLHGLAAKGEKG